MAGEARVRLDMKENGPIDSDGGWRKRSRRTWGERLEE